MANKILSIMLIAVAAVACSKNPVESPVNNDGRMRFEISLPQSSVVTKATSSQFETGDMVGLYATTYAEGEQSVLQVSGNWANNIPLTFNGTDWDPSTPIMWSDDLMDVYAYYPYFPAVSSIDNQAFSIATDQSVEGNGQLSAYEQSDFLWAHTAELTKGETPDPVRLQFKHICAKVRVKLQKGAEFEGAFPDNGYVVIHNTVPSGTIDFASGVVSKDIYGDVEPIICRKVNALSDENGPMYEAIVIPQKVDGRVPFLEYVTDKVSYLAEEAFSLKPGMCYNYVMTISNSPQSIVINIGGSIEDWN